VIQMYFCHQRVAYLLRVWWARGRRRALVSQIKLDSIMRALAFPRMRVYSVSSLHPWNERGTERKRHRFTRKPTRTGCQDRDRTTD